MAVHPQRVELHRFLLRVLFAQWLVAVAAAIWISPVAWSGRSIAIHAHLVAALLAGPVLNLVPAFLASRWPGWWGTRHAFAIAQCGWTALFIHLTGGRIETHFHAFASLALLAFYGDWRVLITATIAITSDHVMRGDPVARVGVRDLEPRDVARLRARRLGPPRRRGPRVVLCARHPRAPASRFTGRRAARRAGRDRGAGSSSGPRSWRPR